MSIALALMAFIGLAIVAWGLAELNYKGFEYHEDVPHHPDPTAHHNADGIELNVRDIMRDNSTKGFKAV